ncbi:hypothetical protein JET14_22480 (plasmid) [Martelella lutilitoris]|uniref:Uncharacterized protein n=1 Tax=Martelella lutilitoris TaxID=2583532 RepID=A0A7T7KNN1_9HYPH|nr:hypothetical protein [Martelella lutilitoris]QQM33021.1 hypothetical protein JET14_22480 [Martelella lutilitoris]QRX65362.1 hypothetical protein JS578_14070 [Dysgonomonadaceae bacterium zrk40]
MSYRSILSRMGDSKEARAARTAFLAVEGLFTLRIWGAEDSADLQSQLDDIEAMLLSDGARN